MKFFKILGLIVLVAVVSANPHGATSYANIHRPESTYDHRHVGGLSNVYDDGHHHDYHHHIPNYKYEYGVDDHHTGDHKTQWETRHGDLVKGAYSFKEADGTMRVVKYKSDGHGGFQAHVERIGHAVHPQHYNHGHNGHGSYGKY